MLTNKEIRQKIINFNNAKSPNKNTLKLLEELAELSEVLLKRLTKQPEDLPNIEKVIEEAGDVFFRLRIVAQDLEIEDKIIDRYFYKHQQLNKWIDKNYKGIV